MELQNEAFHLLRQLFQRHTAHWQRVLPDLAKPQYTVVHSVAKQPSIEQVVLIEAAVSTKATLAEILNRMEACDLVRRGHDLVGRCRRFVYLTEQGEALLSRSIPQGNEIDDELLGRLSDDEREQFTRLMRKMITP